jgi:hypothetical protein
MNKTQLLCTFCSEEQLEDVLVKIVDLYEIAFDSIYVLENTAAPGSLCCTYNINADTQGAEVPESTISLHRKKATNTLYTINALNMLVSELNGGKEDKSFQIPWENYRNVILVTAYGKLKKIPTKLREIIKVQDIV